MPLITIGEIIDLVLMTLFVGYIFSDAIPSRREAYEPLTHYKRGFDVYRLKFAVLATAPAIIFHELAHKFVALGFGLDAVFYAFYRSSFTLMLGIFTIISKLTGFGFMFFIPGFVGISGNGTHLQFGLTAFAGPFVNLVLWLGSWYLIKHRKYGKRHFLLLVLTQRINMFLFIFNMLPLPGFDGYRVFTGLIRAFTG